MARSFDEMSRRAVADTARALGVGEPSTTRLEPQNMSGDPEIALEARVHDPLWLLARQWQFGEFEGEDAGSPIGVRVEATSARITRWSPGDGTGAMAGGAGLALARTDLLEPLIEAEPRAAPAAGTALQGAAEAGMRLVRDLTAAGLGAYRTAFVAAFPLATLPGDDDPAARRLARLIAGRAPDGHAAARALDAAPAGSLPPGLAIPAADQTAVHDVARAWLARYKAEQVASSALPPGGVADCWVPERLEHRFRVGAPGPGGERVLLAPEFGGGRVDWWAFDWTPDTTLGAATDEAPRRLTQALMPTPVRFAGMPADRFWEFEDARVNLGRVEAAPHDLARLLLIEFATVHGNDWLVVPLDVEHGTLTTVESVVYRTTFGDRFQVRATETVQHDDEGWRMFRISVAQASRVLPGLFMPPASPGFLEGPPVEEVLLLRDEMANLAWAVEHLVEGASGRAVDRTREPLPLLAPRPDPKVHPDAELDYLIQTNVPARWIPLVPVRTSGRAFRLVRGALTAVDAAGVRREIPPRSRLLADVGNQRFWVHEEEVPREGARLLRRPASARLTDGRMVRWIGRRLRVGRGEGTSGLAFDAALPRRPGGR
jgi:hypothetical protein